MGFNSYLAGHLRKPSGFFGRLVVAPVLNRLNEPMNALTEQLLELQPFDRVLEVGFGGGDLMHRMARRVVNGRVSGVDLSPEMTTRAAKRFRALVEKGRLEVLCADVESLPFAPGEFTKACTLNTIYFWPDPGRALREMSRVLEPGGRIVLGFTPKSVAEKAPYTKHGFHLYEPDEVGRLLGDAGFQDVRMTTGARKTGAFVCASGTKLAW